MPIEFRPIETCDRPSANVLHKKPVEKGIPLCGPVKSAADAAEQQTTGAVPPASSSVIKQPGRG